MIYSQIRDTIDKQNIEMKPYRKMQIATTSTVSVQKTQLFDRLFDDNFI